MTKQTSKTESEWRADLTDEQYNVCRCGGTEAPFTGKYWDCKTAGIYHCAACHAALFSSATKFDSGTGWPSFFDKLSPEAVGEKTDGTLGMMRTEVVCAACESHLGHVFPDGPRPTGLRYCLNSAALELHPEEN